MATDDFFRSRLDQMIDLRHPLAVLATRLPWAAIEAAVSGLGLTRLLSYQIAPELASGQLRIILAEFENAPIPVHILHREGRLTTAKIRNFIDLLTERLRQDLAL